MSDELWRFDAVLTHSDFLAQLALALASGTQVINAPLRWRIDGPAAPDRGRFSLPPSATVFLFVFDADTESGTIDPLTGHGRKNPRELIEAMAFGKPVITSAWSGNLDFMNLANSCLVRCRVVPLRAGYRYWGFELPPGTLWAEPIKEEAATAKRQLHYDRSFREAIGRRARAGYESHQKAAQAETWIDELKTLHEIFPHRPRVVGKHSSL